MANLTDMLSKFITSNTASTSGSAIPSTSSSPPKVMNHDTEVTKDTMPPTNNRSIEDAQPPVIQVQSQNPISEPNVDPVSAPMPNQRTSIPFPSRRNDERRREKANDQIEKFYEIFRDLSFEISFTDALTLMPKFASTLKTLIGNKEKLSEMARTPLNKNCSAVILNKLPKKLGDPGRFLIPCEFSGINTCNALADLGASINLMPYSVWKDLSLPELTPTCMTLELADRSITEPIGIAKDVRLMVGKVQFPGDFKGDLLILEALLNSARYHPSSNHKDYFTPNPKELKVVEAKTVKSSIDEPPEVELKDLPPHLEYAFLKGDPEFLYSQNSDGRGNNEPNSSESKTVNPKIHDVIKKEVEKLLDAGLIYPISDSPGSPIHVYTKKGWQNRRQNDDNKSDPDQLVTGWRDY
ncbi:reverse transcriptase domain-containing protein [Tanacetum coccineum]